MKDVVRRVGLSIGVAGLMLAGLVTDAPSNRAMSAQQWLAAVEYDYGKCPDWRCLVAPVDSVALVTVNRISKPFWNSSNGQPWNGTEETIANVYSSVRVKVEDVWMGDHLPRKLTLLVYGDASRRVEGKDVPDYAAISGGFTEHDSFVVLLSRFAFPFESGKRTYWTPIRDFEGNWRVHGRMAVGADVSRTLPIGTLRSRLAEVWHD